MLEAASGAEVAFPAGACIPAAAPGRPGTGAAQAAPAAPALLPPARRHTGAVHPRAARSPLPPCPPGADLPCLLQAALCSSLCNDCHLQYAADRGTYQRVGEATEVALRVLAEKVGRGARCRPTVEQRCGTPVARWLAARRVWGLGLQW